MQQGTPAASTDIYYSYTNNRRDGFTYDAAGNLIFDGGQTFTYDATGQQATSNYTNLQNYYDGDGLRVRKTDSSTYGGATYYLRSSVLGGQVVAEIRLDGENGTASWSRGYVYAGSSLLAVQQNGVFFVHEDAVTKSKRVTDINGNVVSSVETDPFGADTNRSSNGAFQPKKYTSYERDANGSDEAMFRRYNRWHSRFDQPDPYDGSYNLSDPQSFNRYAYTQNDPVNFVDPTGLHWELGNCHTRTVTDAEGVHFDHGHEICELVWVNDGPLGFDFGGGNGRGPLRPTPPQPKPSDQKLTPDQKQKVWDQIYKNCRKRKEVERRREQARREREESLRFAATCVIGGVVGAVEGGVEFGPAGVPLGFHFGCTVGAIEHLSSGIAETLLGFPNLSGGKDEADCRDEANLGVSSL